MQAKQFLIQWWHAIKMKHIRGMTMIELVVVTIIIAIVAGIAAEMLRTGFFAYFTQKDIIAADWQARTALSRISRELRAAIPSGLSNSATAITFTNTEEESVTITRDSSENKITLEVDGTERELADSISDLTFSYLEDDGLTTAGSSADVHYITTEITVQNNTADLILRTTINPRNFP